MSNEAIAKIMQDSKKELSEDEEEGAPKTDDNLLKSKNLTQKGRIGNDAFICTKRNPLMKAIYDTALANYHNMESAKSNLGAEKSVDVRIMLTYGNNYRRSAIGMTGPHLVRKVLRSKLFPVLKDDFNLTILDVDSVPVVIKPLRCEEYCLVEPLENTLNWLKVPITKKNSIEEAMEEAFKTIAFELKNFNILRLEDHIRDVTLALNLGGVDVSAEAIAQQLIERISPLTEEYVKDPNRKNSLVVQCVFEFPKVQAFYERANLNLERRAIIWGESESEKIEVLKRHGGEEFLDEILESLTNGRFASIYQKPPQLKQILECICAGVNFINRFVADEDCWGNFASDRNQATDGKKFWDLCEILLNNYAKIHEAIKESSTSNEIKESIVRADNVIRMLEGLFKEIKDRRTKLANKLSDRPYLHM